MPGKWSRGSARDAIFWFLSKYRDGKPSYAQKEKSHVGGGEDGFYVVVGVFKEVKYGRWLYSYLASRTANYLYV